MKYNTIFINQKSDTNSCVAVWVCVHVNECSRSNEIELQIQTLHTLTHTSKFKLKSILYPVSASVFFDILIHSFLDLITYYV